MKLEQMLEHLGLEFEGRLHRLDFESIYSMNIILNIYIVVSMMQQTYRVLHIF